MSRTRVDIRFAALSATQERRVKLAAKTLAAHNVDADAQPWEGSGCALVVLDPDDAYGARVLDVATRRGVHVIAISDSASGLDPAVSPLKAEATTTELARAMLHRLMPDSATQPGQVVRATPVVTRHAATPAAAPRSASASIWTRLTTDLARGDIEVRSGSRRIFLMRSRGRVLAPTWSDMLEARDRFSDGAWALRDIRQDAPEASAAEVTTSLDVFLLHAALRHAATLPDLGTRACVLRDWPDLGGAPEAVDALRVSGMLLQKPFSPRGVATITSLPIATINAYFWAFAAAGLLSEHSATVTPPQPAPSTRPASGLFSRLAAHFGLALR